MNFDFFIIITPILASFILGLTVYSRNRRNLSNKIFGVLSLAIILWAAANYFSLHPVFLSGLFWIRMVMFFAVFLQFMFFLFVLIFPENKVLMKKNVFALLVFITMSTMAIAFTKFLYPIMEERNGEAIPVPGPMMPLFAFTIFLFWGLAAFFTFKKYFQSKGSERVHWQYILLGFIVMFLFLIGSQFIAVVVFQKTDLIKFGPIFTLPFIISSAYAIIKYRLFDIKIIAAKLFTAGILFFLLAKTFLSAGISEFIFNSVILVIMGVLSISLLRAVLKEISDREKIQNLAKDLKKTNIEIAKLSKSKTEFLSIASHQLRTPLTAIKGYISLILEGTYGKLNSKTAEVLDRVYKSNERLIGLINNLLNISRIESGKIKLNPENLKIEDVILDIIKELEIEAKERNLYLSWDSPQTPSPQIYADKEKIREVIFNIIDNAIKYTKKGGIKISRKVIDNYLWLEITDTGAGMTQEEISGIFKSFSRGETGKKIWTDGSGLGLYVAKKFVEMQGGKIWAESQGRGKGSTFNIELPIK